VGGDEFTAILPGIDEKRGQEIVKRIQDAVAEYNRHHPELPISISFGIATATDSSKSLKEIFKKSDDIMYTSKLHKGASAKSQIISTLMTTLGERDYITEGHGRRLSEISIKLGTAIGLSSNQLDNLALLAQVHDLGKVGIPDSILFKKGPLSEEEWDTMRQHPEKGYRIASASTELSGIADLILKHHEKWDGTGYPLGISGEDIPVECRIISIVDAFDAMTNERPYSKAKSIQDAIAEIERCAGTQFDPQLVKTFTTVAGQGRPAAGGQGDGSVVPHDG
jgi:HD-GYP domain-containing protein (c-di-GMP phosphodiesterase class II)